MTYAIVSQTNWHVPKIDAQGRRYTERRFRPPPSMAEASDWPGTYVLQLADDEPPPLEWGHVTYVEDNGALRQLAQYCDASG